MQVQSSTPVTLQITPESIRDIMQMFDVILLYSLQESLITGCNYVHKPRSFTSCLAIATTQ
jgi:hypothetical protein